MDSLIESPYISGACVLLSDMPRLYEQFIDHYAEAALGTDTVNHGGAKTKRFAYCVCAECTFVISMVYRGHAYLEAQADMESRRLKKYLIVAINGAGRPMRYNDEGEVCCTYGCRHG